MRNLINGRRKYLPGLTRLRALLLELVGPLLTRDGMIRVDIRDSSLGADILPCVGYAAGYRYPEGKNEQITCAVRVLHMQQSSVVQALMPVEYFEIGKTLTRANSSNLLCCSLTALCKWVLETKCHCVW